MEQKKPRLKSILGNMIQRCHNRNRKDYKYYGGKGISVCDEWRTFKNFEKWALNNGYSDGLTIDRIDSNKNYCPKNCRWVDMRAQRINQDKVRMIKIGGIEKPLKHWCQEYEISYCAVSQRIHRGMDEMCALLTPINKNYVHNKTAEVCK